MGIYSSAYLVYGIAVTAYDEETDEPTPYWDESAYDGEGDWVKLDSDHLHFFQYGHYEDPDNTRAILTTRRIKTKRADCWDPKVIGPFDLSVSDKDVSKASDDMRVNNLPPGTFYGEADWHLVVSVG